MPKPYDFKTALLKKPLTYSKFSGYTAWGDAMYVEVTEPIGTEGTVFMDDGGTFWFQPTGSSMQIPIRQDQYKEV